MNQRQATPRPRLRLAFLLSPRSSRTAGQLIHVGGGDIHLDRAL